MSKPLLLPKALAAGLGIAAVLTPAAAGSTASSRVKLAVVPLPQKVIGTVAKPLPLSYFSGPVSNAAAPGWTMGYASKGTFTKLGRVSGYVLEYGVASSGGTGVTQVLTSVEQYKSATAAKRGLAFWKKDDALYRQLNQGGFSVTNTALKTPKVGQARFAYLTSYSAANIVPLSTIDERFVEGKYVLGVQASAGTAATAKALAPTLAKKLDARLKLALKGRLHDKAVKLNHPRPIGRAPDGPELSNLALTPSDMSGPAKIQGQHYSRDLAAASWYSLYMEPAGQFDILFEDVYWYATTNEAAFRADWSNAAALTGHSSVALDLSSVGHDAQGVIAPSSYGGGMAEFSLTVGRLDLVVTVGNEDRDIQISDLQNIAQTLAARLDTVYTG
jgi:hypothetical protein